MELRSTQCIVCQKNDWRFDPNFSSSFLKNQLGLIFEFCCNFTVISYSKSNSFRWKLRLTKHFRIIIVQILAMLHAYCLFIEKKREFWRTKSTNSFTNNVVTICRYSKLEQTIWPLGKNFRFSKTSGSNNCQQFVNSFRWCILWVLRWGILWIATFERWAMNYKPFVLNT